MLALRLEESPKPAVEVVLQLERHLQAAETQLRLARTSYDALLTVLATQLRPSCDPPAKPPCLSAEPLRLSPNERRVALLVASGRNNTEVAAALCVSVHTVKSQLRTVYRKLGIHSRWQLAAPR